MVLAPSVAILEYLHECFEDAEYELRTEREPAADRASAALTDDFTLATAILKTHALPSFWSAYHEMAVDTYHGGYQYKNACKFYASNVRQYAHPECLRGNDFGFTRHPTEQPLQLCARLKALGHNVNTIERSALSIPDRQSALSNPYYGPPLAMESIEALEQELTYAYQEFITQWIESERPGMGERMQAFLAR